MMKITYRCPVCGFDQYSYAFSSLRQIYKPDDLQDQKDFAYINCNACGFVSLQNPLSDEELTQCYEDHSYVVKHNWMLEYIMFLYYHISRRLGKGKGKRVLDIGAGDGAYLAYAKVRGWEVSGCDISRYARELAKTHRGVKVLSMEEAEQLPDKYFDLITLYNVLEHLKDPAGILALVKRKLKDDGICIIMIPVFDSWEQDVFKESSAWISAPYHLSLYTEKIMRLLAENNNFKIEKIVNDWYTPSLFSFSIFENIERYFGLYMPLQLRKIVAILIFPLMWPVIILAAIFKKSALRSFYLKHG